MEGECLVRESDALSLFCFVNPSETPSIWKNRNCSARMHRIFQNVAPKSSEPTRFGSGRPNSIYLTKLQPIPSIQGPFWGCTLRSSRSYIPPVRDWRLSSGALPKGFFSENGPGGFMERRGFDAPAPDDVYSSMNCSRRHC